MTLIRVYDDPIGYHDYICDGVEVNFKEKTATIRGGDSDGLTIKNVRGAKVIKDHPVVQGGLFA